MTCKRAKARKGVCMSYFKEVDPNIFTEPHGSKNFPIFTYDATPIKGVTAADAIYYNEEYPTPGVHDDIEGFFVYAGKGYAKVGAEEREIKEGCCFFAPAGVEHMIKKSPECEELRIFLFHFK